MRLLFLLGATVVIAQTAIAQQYRQPANQALPEECPQGRVIRVQKHYPPNMTDCQVLDADTAAENQKLRRPPVGRAAGASLPEPSGAPRMAVPPSPSSASPTPGSPRPQPVGAPAPARPASPPSSPALTVETRAPESARVDYKERIIGQWATSAEYDRFGDGGTFIAVTGSNSIALIVRCIQKELSIAVGFGGFDQKPINKGDLFKIKFRVDAQPVVESYGKAIGDRVIQVVTQPSLVKAIRDGRETAVRVEDVSGVMSTHIFKTAGAPAAFADLSRECPLEGIPAGTDSPPKAQ